MNVYNYLLGENHVYTGTSCKTLYHCMNTDSEGILGSLVLSSFFWRVSCVDSREMVAIFLLIRLCGPPLSFSMLEA